MEKRRPGRPPKIRPDEPPQEFIFEHEVEPGPIDDRPVSVRVKELVDKREVLAESITKSLSETSVMLNDLIALEQNIYLSLSQPDALLSDCPISPAFTKEWARQQLYAAGLKFGEDIWEGVISVKPFVERIRASNPWIMKFAKPPVTKKKGLEAIIEDSI